LAWRPDVPVAGALEICRHRGVDQAGLGRRLRLHVYGVVVVTFTNPDRCRIGREDAVESLCRMLHSRRRAERARSAVKAR
jgi:hypothetical protein